MQPERWRKIEEIYHAALECEESRRPAFLAEACAGDGALREEVESLLAEGFEGARAMGSVGYAQVRAMLAGELPRADLADSIVRATRVFARRQRTWLKHADVIWL